HSEGYKGRWHLRCRPAHRQRCEEVHRDHLHGCAEARLEGHGLHCYLTLQRQQSADHHFQSQSAGQHSEGGYRREDRFAGQRWSVGSGLLAFGFWLWVLGFWLLVLGFFLVCVYKKAGVPLRKPQSE